MTCDLIVGKVYKSCSLCDFVVIRNERSRMMCSLDTLLAMDNRNSVFVQNLLDISRDK